MNRWFNCVLVFALCLGISTSVWSQVDLTRLPVLPAEEAEDPPPDYLVSDIETRAEVYRSAGQRELILSNGLVRRTWRVQPNGACIGIKSLASGQQLLRSVRPEAEVTIGGVRYEVGGLSGQPNHAYLTPEWLDEMESPPGAMRLVDFAIAEPEERFPWMRVRHHDPNAKWPPEGVHLRMEYELPLLSDSELNDLLRTGGGQSAIGQDNQTATHAPPSELGRERLLHDDFRERSAPWRVHVSAASARSSFENEGKVGEIYTPANTAVLAERDLPPGTRIVQATIDVGTDNISASWGPGIALVFENDLVIKFNIRSQGNSYDGKPMLGGFDGKREHPRLGGRVTLDTSVPWTLRLRLADSFVLCDAKPQGGTWKNYGRFKLERPAGEPLAMRVGKMSPKGEAEDHSDSGPPVRCRILDVSAYGEIDVEGLSAVRERMREMRRVRVSVHYEMYDGVPVMSKWITVHNAGSETVTVERFASEVLALVEKDSSVEFREGVSLSKPDMLHVETDFAFGGFNHPQSNRHVVHWRTDPLYSTQVNYLRLTPCLLVVEPTYGPAQDVSPGQSFESFRTFELVYDSTDRERRSLALRRMYRTIAPWITENPIMHHMRDSDPEAVRRAIDQAVEVGFEMIILSFGSGFNIESTDPDYISQWKSIADYAEEEGVEIGGYSLLSSRRIGGGNDVVSPPGQRPTHGNCPALTSEWGQEYFQKLYRFFQATGFELLEHDGSYPGDVDTTSRPPHQKGIADSRWVQWRMITDFYKWCRGNGIYLNVPDYYYLSGSNKCGMGYREVNWSLPRPQQIIHTRQNIFDGTWSKTPSMGWMFVPLTQYHGGGSAATIEPLDEHRDHYERMMNSNLGLGVQACYRGPRLFDTDRTKELVKEWVVWFKAYRDILESDVIHGRRADGRDIDWMMHVNPALEDRGMLVAYNPLDREVTKPIRLDLYYTGLQDVAAISLQDRSTETYKLARDYTVDLDVSVPANGMNWYVIRKP